MAGIRLPSLGYDGSDRWIVCPQCHEVVRADSKHEDGHDPPTQEDQEQSEDYWPGRGVSYYPQPETSEMRTTLQPPSSRSYYNAAASGPTAQASVYDWEPESHISSHRQDYGSFEQDDYAHSCDGDEERRGTGSPQGSQHREAPNPINLLIEAMQRMSQDPTHDHVVSSPLRPSSDQQGIGQHEQGGPPYTFERDREPIRMEQQESQFWDNPAPIEDASHSLYSLVDAIDATFEGESSNRTLYPGSYQQGDEQYNQESSAYRGLEGARALELPSQDHAYPNNDELTDSVDPNIHQQSDQPYEQAGPARRPKPKRRPGRSSNPTYTGSSSNPIDVGNEPSTLTRGLGRATHQASFPTMLPRISTGTTSELAGPEPHGRKRVHPARPKKAKNPPAEKPERLLKPPSSRRRMREVDSESSQPRPSPQAPEPVARREIVPKGRGRKGALDPEKRKITAVTRREGACSNCKNRKIRVSSRSQTNYILPG